MAHWYKLSVKRSSNLLISHVYCAKPKDDFIWFDGLICISQLCFCGSVHTPYWNFSLWNNSFWGQIHWAAVSWVNDLLDGLHNLKLS